MRNWGRIALAFVLVAAVWPTRAWAASCTVTATPMNFGNYDVLAAAPLSTTATIAYRCQPGIPVNPPVLTASPGNGTFTGRYMVQGASRLYYNIYVDAAASIIFGNGAGGTAAITGIVITNARLNDEAIVYGRVPAGQDVAAGPYSDTIVITINF